MKQEALKISVVFLAAGVISALFLIFAAHGYPVPEHDAICYLLPSVNLAAGKGLLNQVVDFAFQQDPTGNFRYLIYPPFFNMVVAKLMWKADGPHALLALAMINTVNMLLGAWIFVTLVRFFRKTVQWADTVLLLGCLAVLAALLCYFNEGRPDSLIYLMNMGAIAAVLLLPKRSHWIILGIIQGAMGATHPLRALSFACIAAMYMAATTPWKKALGAIFLSGLLSILIFIMAIWISPNGLMETLAAISRHGHSQGGTFKVLSIPLSYYVREYFLLPNNLFQGILPLIGLWAGIGVLKRHRKEVQAPAVFYGALFLFFLIAVAYSHFVHNITPYTPFFLGLLIVRLTSLADSQVKKGFLYVFLLVTSASFFRCVLLFPLYMGKGLTLKEARREFQTIERSRPFTRIFYVTYSLWLLSENYDDMKRFQYPTDDMMNSPDFSNMMVFYQQLYRPFFKAPPTMGKFILQKNLFRAEVPTLLGVKIANKVPGYAFALYEPEKDNPSL